MLMTAVEAEVAAYIEAQQHEVDGKGRRLVVRNGQARQRTLVSGVGPLRSGRAPSTTVASMNKAASSVLRPRSCRPTCGRTKSVEELIPWLYLKGISTGDFSEALAALLGPDAPACRPRRWCVSRKSGDATTRLGRSAI